MVLQYNSIFLRELDGMNAAFLHICLKPWRFSKKLQDVKSDFDVISWLSQHYHIISIKGNTVLQRSPSQGLEKFFWDAFSTNRHKTSMTRIKSIGESGSPCLIPRWRTILSLGEPFRRIWVEEVARSLLIMSHQTGPKPKLCRTSKRKGQKPNQKPW